MHHIYIIRLFRGQHVTEHRYLSREAAIDALAFFEELKKEHAGMFQWLELSREEVRHV